MVELCSNPNGQIGKHCKAPGLCHTQGCIDGPSSSLMDLSKPEQHPAAPSPDVKPATPAFEQFAVWLTKAPEAAVYRDAFQVFDQMPKDLSVAVRLQLHDVLYRDCLEAWMEYKIRHGLVN